MITLTLVQPADPTEEIPALSAAEKRQLTKHENLIRTGIDLQQRADAAYVEVGKAYRAIRLAKLYRGSHKTFEVYLDAVWHKKLARVAKLMDAAQVAESLKKSAHGLIPENERQARPLVALMDKPTPTSEPSAESAKRLREVWARILDDAEEGNVKVTAGWITRWLQERGFVPSPTPPQAQPMERSPHGGSSIPANGHGNEQQESYGNSQADDDADDDEPGMPPMEEDPWLYVSSSLDVAVKMATQPTTAKEKKRIIGLLKKAISLLEGQA